jgi:hypothetical protein
MIKPIALIFICLVCFGCTRKVFLPIVYIDRMPKLECVINGEKINVLIDTGCNEVCVIDENIALKYGINGIGPNGSVTVGNGAIQGARFGDKDIEMTFEKANFIIKNPVIMYGGKSNGIILGTPFFRQVNAEINFVKNEVEIFELR